jgi:hypothetical protein
VGRARNVLSPRLGLARESIVIELATVVKVRSVEALYPQSELILRKAPRHGISELLIACHQFEQTSECVAQGRAHVSKLRFEMRLETNQL